MRSLFIVALCAACTPGATGEADAGFQGDPTFTNVKKEIFEPRCSATSCHDSEAPEGNLDLMTGAYAHLVDVPADADPSIMRVTPGDPSTSLLFLVLTGETDIVDPMPKDLPAGFIGQDYINLVSDWIEAGAADD